MSDIALPQPRGGQQPSGLSDLGAAYGRLAVAYRLARRSVFDLHPHGVPESDLTDEQRVVLRDLRLAEADLARQRRLQWERSDVPAVDQPVA